MRATVVLSLLLVAAGLITVVAGMAAPPLTRTCSPAVDVTLCSATVDAALERGLWPVHPLILSGHVEAGPAAGPLQTGHEATVSFDLLGIPGKTDVRMFTDMGGHWGGAVDRTQEEVMLWAMAPLIVTVIVAALLIGIAWRRSGGGRSEPATD